MDKDRLQSYRDKRNFNLTSEPRGDVSAGGDQIFVVQKHNARNLHYDFRLEVDGVLKSWAVPKGPSTDPRKKRLAIETEDHPLEYSRFEGTIPDGQYGAGKVIVWDIGSYINLTEKDGKTVLMGEALEKGHASIWLDGKKLKGGYALTKTARGWILVKMKDEMADSSRDILSVAPRSALSGRSIEEKTEN